jgi:tetratricopeptide (TPR) repeat protein
MSNGSAAQRAWHVSMNIGKQSFQQGRMGDAVSAFGQATKLQPGRVEGWINLGSALIEAGRFAASAAALDHAISLNPRLMPSHMLLGDALRQLGEFKLALASYRQAVAMKRTPLGLNKLACALRVDKELEEAEGLYREASSLDPHFTLALVNLATLYIERGQFEQAWAQLNALAIRSLPPIEREEVVLSQRALSEYFRLEAAITRLQAQRDLEPLQAALANTPEQALGVDQEALRTTRLYLDYARLHVGSTASVAGSPPPDWPLVEGLFMIPYIDTVEEFLNIRSQRGKEQNLTGALLESLNMEAVVVAARDVGNDMHDPVQAELHLRHWHALACREVAGFLPGHFKYTQNWVTRSPTMKRVEPALASGTFRHFIATMYPALEPGLLRAAIVFMAVLDMHPFADGNGRVALVWLNRELEWAGLMPALFRRDLGLKGELGAAMKTVRTNGGDLTPLLAVIKRGQDFAREFCAQLAAH